MLLNNTKDFKKKNIKNFGQKVNVNNHPKKMLIDNCAKYPLQY